MTEVTPGPGWWKATDGEWYPPRWEYRWAMGYVNPKKNHTPVLDELLAQLGREGWEAVSTADSVSSINTSHVSVLMKRPIR